jgi:hypothetical protein
LESVDDGMPFLAKHMEVYTLTAAQKQMFREAVEPRIDTFFENSLDEEGMRWFRRMRETVKAITAGN